MLASPHVSVLRERALTWRLSLRIDVHWLFHLHNPSLVENAPLGHFPHGTILPYKV